jgi:hypothetical protein
MANGILNFDPDEIDQSVLDFYGGNAQQIAQPDAGYFAEFPLPNSEPQTAFTSDPMGFTQDPNVTPQQSEDIFAIRQKIAQNAEMARRGFNMPTGFSQVDAEGLQQVYPELNLSMAGQDLFSAVNNDQASEIQRRMEELVGLQSSEAEQSAMMPFMPSQTSSAPATRVSTPVDRTLQDRITELEMMNQGKMPQFGFMGSNLDLGNMGY